MRDDEFIQQANIENKKAYLIQDLVVLNRMSMIASQPGEGKSMVGMALLYHVVYGARFLGLDVVAGNAMFLDSENRRDVLSSRGSKIKNGLEMDGYKMQGKVDFQHYSGFLLDDKTTWPPVVQEIRTLQPSLILIDHLAMFHRQNEDKSIPMTRVTVAIEELMSICNSTLLILHHFNKNEGTFIKRLRGSSAIYAKTDAAFEVRTLLKENGRLKVIGIIPQARKDITGQPMLIKINEGNDWMKFTYDGVYQPIGDPKSDSMAHKFYHIFLDDKDEKTVLDIKQISAGYASDQEIRQCLRLLEDKGLLESKRRKLGGRLFYGFPFNGKKKCPWCNREFII